MERPGKKPHCASESHAQLGGQQSGNRCVFLTPYKLWTEVRSVGSYWDFDLEQQASISTQMVFGQLRLTD